MNKVWHEAHRLGKNAPQAMRVKWHVTHAKVCNCRPMPESIKRLLKS